MPTLSFSDTLHVLEVVGVVLLFFFRRASSAEVSQAAQERLSVDLSKLSESVEKLETTVHSLSVQFARMQTSMDFMTPPHSQKYTNNAN